MYILKNGVLKAGFPNCWCLVHGSDTSRGRLLYIHHPEFLGVPIKQWDAPKTSGELSNKPTSQKLVQFNTNASKFQAGL
jgi:hypothetical protein